MKPQAPSPPRTPSRRLPLWGLLAALLLAGCRTCPALSPVDLTAPGWKLRQGQAVWRSKPEAPEIAGELLLATHSDGRAFLQFTKTPIPFVVVQTASNAWQIEFVADNRTYSGHGTGPGRIGWLQVARSFTGATPKPPWHWEDRPGNGWRLENQRGGETIEGYLTP